MPSSNTRSSERRFPHRPVAIGLGSNLGDRLGHLQAGAAALGGLLREPRFSSVYETEPLYEPDQPPFLNACCVGLTDLTAPELLARLKEIEQAAGRTPGGARFGPRELDLDILLYGEKILEGPDLGIPHPRLEERAFALAPLSEIAGDWRHPVLGRTVRELAMAVETTGVRPTPYGLEVGTAEGAGDPEDENAE